jgi:hypothetical protein
MILGSPAPIDVQRELAAMRAELAEIRVAQREEWIDRERAKELRAVVADAMADSATRASFATEGATTGYENGAFIRSGDGNWMFKIGVMNQVRFVYNNASNQPSVDNTWGMETHRVNLTLSGTIIDPSVQWLALASYNSQPDRFVERAQEVVMQYSWICKDFGDGFSATAGLQNVPWDIESTFYGSSKITAGEYSAFNYRFGTGKNTGITGKYQCDSWRVTGGTFSQLDTRSTGWNSRINLSYAFAMRAEAKIGATWKEVELQSSLPGSTPGVLFGLGTLWSNGRADNPETPPTPASQGFTADVRTTLSGTTLIAQFALMKDPAGLQTLEWASGINMQGSTFITDDFQVFVEGSWMDTADVPWIAQVGANVYFAERKVKFTNRIIVPFGSGEINGIRAVAGGFGLANYGNNVSLVSQLQLLF